MQILYRLGLPVLAGMLLVGSCFLLVKLGEKQGRADVQMEWAESAAKHKAAMATLQGKYNALAEQHTLRLKELSDELTLSNARHKNELSQYRSDYAERLRLASNRASVYQRQAQGSTIERDNLAEHAARLDRSLEEGRSLVRELRATLGQREVTIRSLGGIILIDRTLLESN